ncbi:MAG: hypothetical protein HYV65_00570 [Candidatus Spechtbacteria bacterium]|nr:hypothetical protein [Candidatus Spechtbacteria bacterium]
MQRNILSTMFFFLASAILVTGFVPFALAADPGPIQIQNPIDSDTFTALLDRVLDTIIVFAGPVLLIIIVYAAFLFMISGGNATQLRTAKEVLKWALIGFTVIVLAKIIVSILRYAIAGI